MFMFEFSQTNSPAAKAHLEAQFAMFSDLSKQIFGAAQRLNELNIQVAQTLMEESLSGAQQILSAKDPTEALSVIAGQAQPHAEKVRAYQQHLADISAGTQVELAKTVENHVPQTSRTAQELAREVAQKASEETQKVTQRQQAAMEKMKTPINKRQESGKGSQQSSH
jgi:phasin family protein